MNGAGNIGRLRLRRSRNGHSAIVSAKTKRREAEDAEALAEKDNFCRQDGSTRESQHAPLTERRLQPARPQARLACHQ